MVSYYIIFECRFREIEMILIKFIFVYLKNISEYVKLIICFSEVICCN